MVLRRVLALLLASTLAGCASLFDRTIAAEDRSKIRSLGVTSMLGTEFVVSYVGTTVFNNYFYRFDVAEWGVDDFLARQTVDRLSGSGFRVASLDRPPTTTVGRAEREFGLSDALAQAATNQGFDTLLVVRPIGVNQLFPPGYGIHGRAFIGRGFSCVFANYLIEVYTVATRKRLTFASPDTPCDTTKGEMMVMRRAAEQYSPDDRKILQQALTKQFTEAIRETLDKIGLDKRAP